MSHTNILRSVLSTILLLGFITSIYAQRLDEQLKEVPFKKLADQARDLGRARQGAVLFYQQAMACRKCHQPNEQGEQLAPKLFVWEQKPTDEELIESILYPSKKIRKGFESVTLVEESGKVRNGVLIQQTDKTVTYRSLDSGSKAVTVERDSLEEVMLSKKSLMPEGLVNLLSNRQQFHDLLKYLMEIRDGGQQMARVLEPPRHLYEIPPLPAYEQSIDHAGLLADLNHDSFMRGEAIYNRLCINCHGTKDKPGSLPTSLKFASGQFRNGSDPYSIYQTITRGYGMMQPQYWMVPQQKYDVIHYIREAYLKPHNPSQYVDITPDYLSDLPSGTERGPTPLTNEPWVAMNYGDSLINTYEAGTNTGNFNYKGIAVRLDHGPGGVSQGNQWIVFDHDTLRLGAAWSGQGFIDWNGIHFNGRHGIHPTTVGEIAFSNPVGPGWAHPETGSWEDPRLRGRDDKPYGPLPREWAHYEGVYRYGQRRVLSYTVGETSVLESPVLLMSDPMPVYGRQMEIAAHNRPLNIAIATLPEGQEYEVDVERKKDRQHLLLKVDDHPSATTEQFRFNGSSFAQVPRKHQFNLTTQDFSITARIRTKTGGTIFSQTVDGPKWVPDGKALFIRDGRLCYDIGWVGVVTSKVRINDGKWHDVVMSWNQESGRVRLYIDGKLDQEKELRPKGTLENSVLRFGFASPNYPSKTYFEGQIENVAFYNRSGSPADLSASSPQASWTITKTTQNWIKDTRGEADARIVERINPAKLAPHNLFAGVDNPAVSLERQGRRIVLKLPPSEDTQKFTVWVSAIKDPVDGKKMILPLMSQLKELPDLRGLMSGGPADWPEILTTQRETIVSGGSFEVDQFSLPTENPWNALVRATGFDFDPTGEQAIVCTWDGDVWRVGGLHDAKGQLHWQRIASGLFQPLGLKLVDGEIYVSCRDQIVKLHDFNNDGETDYYENFNNDHQVTEHFHEFAMGLQTDDEGNFYYAKSARHAKTALVPHHGTLLRVSSDGEQTEILANGFRAANGVCLNPDGSFIVTDQEGHWNPKNRINWVHKGGFYGNMYGYHDVLDESDEAMEQPLCWITNAFDRSPAELLWVPEDAWGKLGGSLVNLSYGYGKAFLVLHEEVDGQMQGGMIELPLPQFPTGLMRGRFHPEEKQLYVCGMVAWGSNQRTPGGFYRIRKTEQPSNLPVELHAKKSGLEIVFSDPLDADSVKDIGNYSVVAWDLVRSKNYGSRHYNERLLKITHASLSDDGRAVFLTIPEIAPTRGMEIKYFLINRQGQKVEGIIHNSIHEFPDSARVGLVR